MPNGYVERELEARATLRAENKRLRDENKRLKAIADELQGIIRDTIVTAERGLEARNSVKK